MIKATNKPSCNKLGLFIYGIIFLQKLGTDFKSAPAQVIPDFIFQKLGLASEIKFTKNKTKTIVDEINADIRGYGKDYSNLLFLIYDIGTIRDENEFKNDIDNEDNIQLIIVKH